MSGPFRHFSRFEFSALPNFSLNIPYVIIDVYSLGHVLEMPGGWIVVRSLEEALAEADSKKPGEEVFIIGGAEVFRLALPLAGRLYFSIIPGSYPGDTYFPEIDPQNWLLSREESRKGFLLKMFKKAV